MKKILLVWAALLLVLCGCKAQEAPVLETTEAPAMTMTTAPETETTEAETLPPEVKATVLGKNCPVILGFLSRGDTVEVVKHQEDGFYFVKTGLGYGLIDENLLRPEGKEPFASWDGYAAWGTVLHDNFYLTGEGTALGTNQKVTVIEDLQDCLLVETESGSGYVEAGKISRWPLDYSGGSDGGSGGGGGYQDGGDIEMQMAPALELLSLVKQSGEISGPAAVLADGVPVYLGFYDRLEEISILEELDPDHSMEGYETVYRDSLWAYVPSELLRLPGEPAYEAWQGFSAWPGEAYEDYRLSGKPERIVPTNTKLQILEEFEASYLVSLEESLYFMPKAHVTRQPTVFAPSDSGGSSGGSGGNSGWTPPIL